MSLTALASDDSLLNKALTLLDQRQQPESSANPDLDTHFYNAVLECLLSNNVDHWWCSPTLLPLARESLWLFSLPTNDPIAQYKRKLDHILQRCPSCVQSYHTSKKAMRLSYLNHFSAENVRQFFDVLETFDKTRLAASLASSVTSLTDLHSCAITEIVCSPHYVIDADTQLCALFDQIQTSGLFPTLENDLAPGLSIFAFYHHRVIRLWARKLLERFAAAATAAEKGDEEEEEVHIKDEDDKKLMGTAQVLLAYFNQPSDPLFVMTLRPYDDDGNEGDNKARTYTLPTTNDKADMWKGLRSIIHLLTTAGLATLTSNNNMLTLLEHQLNPSNLCLPDVLKTMHLLLDRLGNRFWTNETLRVTPGSTFYNVIKRICNHPGFRQMTKIAQDKADTILMRDGREYPRDKLIQRMQLTVSWVYPFWHSLRSLADIGTVTDDLLDTLLGYFQHASWSPLFKAITAKVAFDILETCKADDKNDGSGLPVAKINEYAGNWITYALINKEEHVHYTDLPASLDHLSVAARSLLTELLCQDTRSLRDTYITLVREDTISSSSSPTMPLASDHQAIWDHLYGKPASELVMILPTLLSAFAPLVSIYSVQQQQPSATDAAIAPLVERMQNLRSMVSLCLDLRATHSWETCRKLIVLDPGMTLPLVSLLASTDITLRQSACRLMAPSSSSSSPSLATTSNSVRVPDDTVYASLKLLFDHRPMAALEAMTATLENFLELANGRIETYHIASALGHALACCTYFLIDDEDGYLLQMVAVTQEDNDKDQHSIKFFWKNTWQVLNTIFSSSLQWASKYRPKEILERVMPWMEIAQHFMNNRALFQKAAYHELETDAVVLAADSLSSWIYVTRTSVLAKLVPLLNTIMQQLQKLHVKISLEAYDRLMSAATNLNPTKMDAEQKEMLFTSLSAHEPTNAIFLDDSDDEQIEWQSITTSSMDTVPSTTTSFTSGHIQPTPTPMSLSPPASKPASMSPLSSLRTMTLSPPSSYYSTMPTSSSTSSASSRPRQVTLNESFKHSNSPLSDLAGIKPSKYGYVPNTKITTFFGNTKEDKQKPMDDFFTDMAPVKSSSTSRSKSIPSSPSSSSSSSLRSTGGIRSTSNKKDQTYRNIPHGATSTAAAAAPLSTLATKPTSRVFPQNPNPSSTYAVTSTGRRLKAPSMGYSKVQQLRDESSAERRLGATTKSPSARAMERRRLGLKSDDNEDNSDDSDDDNSEDEDDDDGDASGLLGLVQDINDRQVLEEKERVGNMIIQYDESVSSSNMRDLFDTDQPRRSTKLIDTPTTSHPIFQQRAQARQAEKERKMKMMPDIDRLYKSILSWSLENTKSDTPPNTSNSTFNHVQDTYDQVRDYFGVFEPLLLLEVWSQFVRSKDMLTAADVMERFEMTHRCHVNDFVDVTFNVPLSTHNVLATDDLVCLANHFGSDFFSSTTMMIRGAALAASEQQKGNQWHGKAFLAKVMAVTQRKHMGDITVRCYFTPDRIQVLNSLSPKSIWRCVKITSLSTVQREYAALQGLQYYELANDILHPHPTPMPTIPPQAVKECIKRYGVNQPQAEAIIGALKKKKGFTLIQGPPGTGKTKTILGLIVNLLDQRKVNDKSNTGKILVCAPSNAAVDEIAKRLKDGITTSDGLVKPNVVRIGVADSVNASVKDLVLDRLIEKELTPVVNEDNNNDGRDGNSNNNIKNKNFSGRREKILETMKKLQLDIEQIDRDLVGTNEIRMTSELRDKKKQLIQQRDRQRTMLKDVQEDQRDHSRELESSRVKARLKVFADCDIVCATLSGSGHSLLSEMGLCFDTVIVDEAAQAVEVSSLIPLKYDCRRCILVGDPNQLPPTVISLLASKYSYQQSLFVRLEKNAPDNVYLLSIQYRMHPDISAFPSQLFYQSRLLDGPQMADSAAAIWHTHPSFPPYKFYNIQDGQERQGYGASLFNTSEADAAVTLVDMLANAYPGIKLAYKIGVITPYKQQVSQLKSRFERRFGSKILNVIDFNTVDGFQGQEKEIIIFSCVRASAGGYGSTIGFLSDIRRMNVGLTRAKRSLFILGHAKSLRQDEYWGNLVENAKERKLLQDCQYPYFNHRLVPDQRPGNLYESEVVVSKKRIQVRKTAKPIMIPSADDEDDIPTVVVGRKHARHDSSDVSSPPSKRQLHQPKSLSSSSSLPSPAHIRLDNDNKSSFTSSSPTPLYPTAEQRGRGRGAGGPPGGGGGGGRGATSANLFIPKSKNISFKKSPSHTLQGISARERISMEHQGQKDHLRRIRQQEAIQSQGQQKQHNNNNDNPLDDLLEIVKSSSDQQHRHPHHHRR